MNAGIPKNVLKWPKKKERKKGWDDRAGPTGGAHGDAAGRTL